MGGIALDHEPRPLRRAPLWRLLLRGLLCRCPLCGERRPFDTWFRVKERCPRCNFPLRRVEGTEVGALGMNTVVTFGAVLVTVVGGLVVTYPDTPVVPLVVVCAAVAVLLPIWFYPRSWTVWAAIDLAMRPIEAGDRVHPDWVPDRRGRRR